MKSRSVIKVDPQKFIASGAFCECFEHPADLQVCIKIPTSNEKAQKRLKADLKYYKKLYARNVNMEHVANYIEECDTSEGRGYLYECVRDFDGKVSQTLASYKESLQGGGELLNNELLKVGKYLVEQRILIGDLHSRNILIQLSEDGSLKPIIVDGIGDRVGVPILNIFPSLVTAKIKRRWNRFVRKELDSCLLLEE